MLPRGISTYNLIVPAKALKQAKKTSIKLGNRHTRGSARTTNARERSTRGLTSEPVPSAIMTALQIAEILCSRSSK